MNKKIECKLQDICSNITDGKHGDCQNQENSGFYFVSCKDVFDGKINLKNAREITESDYIDTHKRTRLENNDIVITNSGSIGRMAFVKDLSHNITFQKSVAIVKPEKDKVIPRFLYYYLLSNVDRLIETSGGTAQKNLLLSDMRNFDVAINDIITQKKITFILSAYDDLIENNNRRIAILKGMVQRLYREWFEYFRFPGYENVGIVESEIGLIPEGWTVTTAGNISDKIFSGGTPTTMQQSYWDGPLPWLSSGETRDEFIVSTEKCITEEGVKNSSTRLAKRFDIVVASAGQGKTRGQTSLLLLDTYINQSVISIRVKEYCTAYTFFNISSRYEELRSISDASSIRGSLTTEIFNYLPILLPDMQTLQQYNAIAMSNILLIENLRRRNENLRKTRDLLLPRLISGNIDVSGLISKEEE